MLLLQLLVAACATPPKPDPSARAARIHEREARRAEAADPYSDAALQRYADEMLPEVEAAAGRPFQSRPTVTWIDPDVLGQLIVDENTLIFDRLYPGFTPERKQQMAEAARHSLGALLGKYTPETHTVHLNQQTLTTLPEARVDVTVGRRLVKLTLAHELAHALQNEQVSTWDTLLACPHEDAVQGWMGATEGQATWIERKVAEKLGWMEEHHIMTQLQGWKDDALIEPMAFDVWATYGLGMQFARAIETERGTDGLWSVAAAPPPRTSMLFHPETYQPTEPPTDLDYAGLLTSVLGELTRNREWNHINTPVGERVLRKEAKFTDGRELDAVLEHLVHAQQIEGELPDRSATVRLLVLDSPEWADRYIELLRSERLEETKAYALAIGRPLTVTHEPFDEVEADDSLLRIEQLLTDGGGLVQENRIFYAVRKNAVVMVTAERFRPGLRAGRAVESVFGAYEAAKSQP